MSNGRGRCSSEVFSWSNMLYNSFNWSGKGVSLLSMAATPIVIFDADHSRQI